MSDTKTLTIEDFKSFTTKLMLEHQSISINEIENIIIEYKGRCKDCQRRFRQGNIEYYRHENGINIQEANEKVWIYFHCTCGYETALWKVLKDIKIMLELKQHGCPSIFHTSLSHIKILDYMYYDKETGQAIDYEEQWFVPVTDKQYYSKLSNDLPLVELECPHCGESVKGKYALTTQLWGVK